LTEFELSRIKVGSPSLNSSGEYLFAPIYNGLPNLLVTSVTLRVYAANNEQPKYLDYTDSDIYLSPKSTSQFAKHIMLSRDGRVPRVSIVNAKGHEEKE